MGVILAEGFRHIPGVGDRVLLSTGGSGTYTWSRVANRSGGYALRGVNSGTLLSPSYCGTVSVALPLLTNMSAGWAVNFTGSGSGVASGILGFNLTSSTGQGSIAAGYSPGSSIGNLSTTSGMSVGVIKDASIMTQGWHWFNLVVSQYGNATTGYARFYRDGLLVAEWTPDLLPSTGSAVMGRLDIAVGNDNAAVPIGSHLADLIIRDDATVIPDSRVDVLTPTNTTAAAWVGSDADSVNNHLLIDDAGPTVDTSDYVTTATVGATDTYGLSDLPFNPTTIHGVSVNALGRKTGAGARGTCVMLNGVEGTAMDTGAAGAVYGNWTTNPSGGAAWTKAAVDAMTAGIRIKT